MSAIDTILDGLFAFGRVVRSMQSSRSSNVLVDLHGDEDDDGTVELHSEREVFIASPLLYQPARPSPDGASEEVLFIRRGDDAVIIGSRDARWRIEIVEGEAVLRSLGEGGAYVRVRPDGEIVLAGTVKIGERAIKRLALSEVVDRLLSWAATHTHNDPVSGVTSAPTAPPSDTASASQSVEVES